MVPYLHALGVTHLYTSPFLAAGAGSTHGYDITDHARVNPDVGTDADLDGVESSALQSPGHGAAARHRAQPHEYVGPGNGWWADVLEHGPASPYAGHFDIAWDDSPRPQMKGPAAAAGVG